MHCTLEQCYISFMAIPPIVYNNSKPHSTSSSDTSPNRNAPRLRKIIHVDMDCFFAAVEIRDQPQLAGQPIAVGFPDAQRGVLCTASYEARKFGVRAAMPNRLAFQKCPQLIVVPPRMRVYQEESRAIRAIFERYTSLIEPLSLDEAFLDVTDSPACGGSATLIAKEITAAIWAERKLSASAGIAPNKFLAKIASDLHKPRGICTIAPAQVQDFIKTLQVEKLWGVGPKSAERLKAQGFHTCHDLQQARPVELELQFGKMGAHLAKLCRGIDESPVNPNRERKSFSKERTFGTNQARSQASSIAQELFEQLEHDFKQWQSKHNQYRAVGLEVKVRFGDFYTTTVHFKGSTSKERIPELIRIALERHHGEIRLIGVGYQLLPPQDCEQLILDLWGMAA